MRPSHAEKNKTPRGERGFAGRRSRTAGGWGSGRLPERAVRTSYTSVAQNARMAVLLNPKTNGFAAGAAAGNVRIDTRWGASDVVAGTHCHRWAFSCQRQTFGMGTFMPRIAILGLALSTFLSLLSSSAVPQERARAGIDDGSGQLIFNNACRTCHTTKEGDNRLGPNLHNIIGRKAGSLPNFGYSSAMKGAEFVWDKEKLDSFIAKPDEVVPGNNMKPYGGLASAEDRTKLIAFLQSAASD
jgi:cytochrome c